jgi:hypothetical protein
MADNNTAPRFSSYHSTPVQSSTLTWKYTDSQGNETFSEAVVKYSEQGVAVRVVLRVKTQTSEIEIPLESMVVRAFARMIQQPTNTVVDVNGDSAQTAALRSIHELLANAFRSTCSSETR